MECDVVDTKFEETSGLEYSSYCKRWGRILGLFNVTTDLWFPYNCGHVVV
jgi:hypothetical protein